MVMLMLEEDEGVKPVCISDIICIFGSKYKIYFANLRACNPETFVVPLEMRSDDEDVWDCVAAWSCAPSC